MWVEGIREELRDVLDTKEGVCGICHGVLVEISDKGGKAISYERPEGVFAEIYDNVVAEGFDIVSASAILRAELKSGLVPNHTIQNSKKPFPHKMI